MFEGLGLVGGGGGGCRGPLGVGLWGGWVRGGAYTAAADAGGAT